MTKSSWSPFKLSGTELSPNVLLLVKLMFLLMLLKHFVEVLPEPFLPFVSFFRFVTKSRNEVGISINFSPCWPWLCFFNRAVRLNCLLLGFVILIAILSSRNSYLNGRVFCAFGFYFGRSTKRWGAALFSSSPGGAALFWLGIK